MQQFKAFIKQHIIAVLFGWFVAGAIFIWSIGVVSPVHITDDGKLSGTVLWLTALAIFWYAYETYQLKLSSSQQADTQEVIMQNEFLPILEPVGRGRGATLKAGRFTDFQMRNLGKGPAKYIELHIGNISVPLDWSLAGGERELVKLPAVARDQLAVQLQANPPKVTMRIIYQDIYKRKFQTQHIVFRKTPRGGYRLRQGSWDFKRIRT